MARRIRVWLSALCIGLALVPAQLNAQEAGDLFRDLLRGFADQQNNDPEKLGPARPGGSNEQIRRLPFGRANMQLSFAPLVKQTSPSVVNVYAARRVERRSPFEGDPFFEQFFGDQFRGPPRVQSSLGSGVIVDSSGLVVTNNHVIENANEIRVVLADGREFESTIVLRDERSDLAVLRLSVRNERFAALPLGNSDQLENGDLVLAIGNPFGVGQTITSGIISAQARTRVGVSDFGFFIQTDAAINPGNSGGALIDMQGRLIGINTAIFSRSGGSNGIGFAIPSNMVRAVVEQARGGSDAFERPYLGATFDEITPAIAESLGLRRPIGALVSDIAPNGPADRAGLRLGDVVLGIDDVFIEHPEALGYRLATSGPGAVVTLEVLSRGARRSIDVRLERQSAAPEPQTAIIGGRSPFTGSTVAEITPPMVRTYRLALRKGVVIVDVDPRSPAARYGMREGDVIVMINGEAINTTADAKRVGEQDTRGWRFGVNRQGRRLQQVLRF